MPQTMLDPYFAREVWRRFRVSRPLGGGSIVNHRPVETKPESAEASAPPAANPPQAPQPGNKSIEGEPFMIKLNAGISRKVGESNYGSRGAAVNVELELESSAAQDTQLLQDRIRKLFTIARDAVNEELGLNSNGQPVPQPSQKNGNGNLRPATEAQLRAIRAICERLGLDPQDEALSRVKQGLAELTLPNASLLIGQLNSLHSNGQ